jgi:hypothetical protein
MKRNLIILLVALVFQNMYGQSPVGTWSDHLTYNSAKSIAVGSKEVYASTGSSIIVYNKEFAELRKMSRINGLTETGISTIGWSEDNNTLIIAYSSTNIDLVKNHIISNIPDISRKYIPGKKEINRIRTNGKYAYLAASFGIVVIDINKTEIFDTWKPGDGYEDTDVWDIAFGNGKIYAATGTGVFSADLSDPGLSYFGSWKRINILPYPAGKFTSLVFTANKLYANLSGYPSEGNLVYVVTDGLSSQFSYFPGTSVISFDQAPNGFTISSSTSVNYYNNDGSLIKTLPSYSLNESVPPNISQAVVDGSDIWIADINTGLVRGENMSVFSAMTLPGPVSNNAINITSSNGKTIICGGALTATWNNLWSPLQVSVFENNKWNLFSSAGIKDAIRSVVDPDNPDHFFVSTWGGGLLEYENNGLVKQYTETNSPLQTIIPGQPYVRICGLAMDKNKYLWITQTEVPGSIKILKPDGSWIVNPVTINAPTIGDIIITRTGQKWIVLPRGNGLFILDDNRTPDIFTDDKSKKILVKDSKNNVFSNIFSIAEDLDGNIWVGTDQGPLIYYNPEKAFESDLTALRIIIPRNDGTGLGDYMLGTEVITSIAIDGANRKWIGTLNSGAYLLSPDGMTRIKNFNEQNSPILSNSVNSIAVDNKTGEIWFGTSKGVQSLRGNAISGVEEFKNVYAFPNPAREDFRGNVTITGLIRNSQIRITDISGNLVYETVSDGGMATWDLKTYNGNHVATGVYLIFCASADGSQSFVTKMLVIK